MNPAPTLAFWWQLIGTLALESVAVIGLAALALQFTRAAVWRRTIWQICTLGLAVLMLIEVTGLSRLLANLRNAPFSVPSADSLKAGLQTQFAPFPGNQEVRHGAKHDLAASEGTPAFLSAIHAINSPQADRNFGAPSIARNPPSQPTAPDFGDGWPGWVWLIGAGLVLARVGLARCLSIVFRHRSKPVRDPDLKRRLQELARQLGLSRPIRLIESAQLSSPLAFGVIAPTIGLPAQFGAHFSHAQQAAILAHELAHLAARDPAWHLLADLVAAAGWWNPLVWWTRRQLHAAGEAAADEASLLVANGPFVLAECLLELGAQLTQRRAFGWMGIDGNGFRSGLGRRVERLVQLAGHGWRPPSRIRSGVVKTIGLAILVTVGILCTAWAAPRASTKGDMKPSWKNSLAAFALAAIVSQEDNLTPKAAPPSLNIQRPALTLAPPSTGEGHDMPFHFTLSSSSSGTHFHPMGEDNVGDSHYQLIGAAGVESPMPDSTGYGNPDIPKAARFAPLPSNSPIPGHLYPSEPMDEGLNGCFAPRHAREAHLYPSEPIEIPGVGWLSLATVAEVPYPRRPIPLQTFLVRQITNGQTSVPGGLISDEVRRQLSKVPVLGDIPLLGRLFRSERIGALASAGPQSSEQAVSHNSDSPKAAPTGEASQRRRSILAKLEQITFTEVQFKNTPLSEVVQFLDAEACQRDPEKQGINFIISRQQNFAEAYRDGRILARLDAFNKGMEVLNKEMDVQEDLVNRAQTNLANLRTELGISEAVAESGQPVTLEPETVRRLEDARLDALAAYNQINELVTNLQRLSRTELREVLPTAWPDQLLTELLSREAQVQQQLSTSNHDYNENHPNVVQIKELLKTPLSMGLISWPNATWKT